MAFVVEDGTGLPTATSYASVAEANAYFMDDTRLPNWSAAMSQVLTVTAEIQAGGSAIEDDTLLTDIDWGGDALDGGVGEILRISGDDKAGDPIVAVDVQIDEGATVADLRAAIITAKGGGQTTLIEGILRFVETPGDSSGTLNILLVDGEAPGTTTGEFVFTESTAGDDAGEAAQQAALIAGTRYIDLHCAPLFNGRRNSLSQGLQWPRTGARDSRGNLVGDDELPAVLKQAAFECAYVFRLDPTLVGTSSASRVVTRRRERLGDIEQDLTFASPTDENFLALVPIAAQLLAEFLDAGAVVGAEVASA